MVQSGEALSWCSGGVVMSVASPSEKIELFILSLWFLFLLIIVVTIDVPVYFGSDFKLVSLPDLLKKNVVPLISSLPLFLGALYYLRFDYRVAGSTNIPVQITRIEDVSYEHLTFLTTYIIPLICFNLTSARYLIALAILLVVIGTIYVKTDKFYANPTLAVLGFRVYKVDIKSRFGSTSNIVIVTKDKLSGNDLIKTLALDEKIFYGRKV